MKTASTVVVSIEVPPIRDAGPLWVLSSLLLFLAGMAVIWLLSPPIWHSNADAAVQLALQTGTGELPGLHPWWAAGLRQLAGQVPAYAGQLYGILHLLLLLSAASTVVGLLIRRFDVQYRLFTPLVLVVALLWVPVLFHRWSGTTTAAWLAMGGSICLAADCRNPARAWLSRPGSWIGVAVISLAGLMNPLATLVQAGLLFVALLLDFAKVGGHHKAAYMPEVRFHLRRILFMALLLTGIVFLDRVPGAEALLPAPAAWTFGQVDLSAVTQDVPFRLSAVWGALMLLIWLSQLRRLAICFVLAIAGAAACFFLEGSVPGLAADIRLPVLMQVLILPGCGCLAAPTPISRTAKHLIWLVVLSALVFVAVPLQQDAVNVLIDRKDHRPVFQVEALDGQLYRLDQLQPLTPARPETRE